MNDKIKSQLDAILKGGGDENSNGSENESDKVFDYSGFTIGAQDIKSEIKDYFSSKPSTQISQPEIIPKIEEIKKEKESVNKE